MNQPTRRQWLRGGLVAGAALTALSARAEVTAHGPEYRYCLNTSTIRGAKLDLVKQIEVAAKAGYDGIEVWIRDIEDHVKSGGGLRDVAKRLADLNLRVESAIGFAPWIVDEDDKRKQGLEQAAREMDLVKQIGGSRIAAPPSGATGQSDLDLRKAAERYRALLEVGEKIGVVPQVEVWGFSKSLSRLGESAFVAIESGHPKACILPDVFHLYKGGNAFSGLSMLSGSAIQVFHMNDYPADPPRDRINDSARVYPGDGVAPMKEIFDIFTKIGFRGVLSLELFNRDYWKQDPLRVARTGLAKMKAVAKGVGDSR